MSEDIKFEYDIEKDENWEEYIDWYTITFGDDEEEFENLESQKRQSICKERCWYNEDCYKNCMEEYRN